VGTALTEGVEVLEIGNVVDEGLFVFEEDGGVGADFEDGPGEGEEMGRRGGSGCEEGLGCEKEFETG